MADETRPISEEEKLLDALSDSSTSLDVLALSLAQLQGHTDSLVQLIGRTDGAALAVFQGLNRLTSTLGQLKGSINNTDSYDAERLLAGIRQMTSKDLQDLGSSLSSLIAGVKNDIVALRPDYKKVDFSKGIQDMFLELDKAFAEVLKQTTESIKTATKAKPPKVDLSPIVEAAKISKPSAADYKSAYTQVASSTLRTKSAQTALNALYQPVRAKDLSYPAASGGLYHQAWSDVGLHSLDMATIIKNLGLEKVNIQAVLAESLGEAVKGMNLAQIVSAYGKKAGLDISPEEAKKSLKSQTVTDTAAVAAFIHDIGKSGGKNGITGFSGYKGDHAGDAAKLLSSLPATLDAKSRSIAETAVQAALVHHDSSLKDSPVSKLDKDSQVVAILLRIADAVSAANDNKVGATGRKESIISPSGLSQAPHSARVSPVEPAQEQYRRLTTYAALEENPRDAVYQLMTKYMGGTAEEQSYSKKVLEGLNLGQLIQAIDNSSQEAKQLLAWLSSANGRSTVGDRTAQQALLSLMGDNQGHIDAKGRRISTETEAKQLKLSDPALVWAQSLYPNAFHELVERFKTSPAAGDESIDPSNPRGFATSSKPATNLESLSAFLGAALQSAAGESNFGEQVDKAVATYLGKVAAQAQPKPQEKTGPSPSEYIPASQPFRNESATPQSRAQDLQDHMDALALAQQGKIAAFQASDKYIEELNHKATQLLAGADPKDAEQLSTAIKKGVDAQYKYLLTQAGMPQAEVSKVKAEAARIEQSIQESIAKASVMSARADKTNTENQFLIETADTRKQKLIEETNRAAAQAVQEQVKAETALATEADKVSQIKADTLAKMSKLTEQQQSQVKAETSSSLAASKITPKDFTVPPETLEPYKAKVEEIKLALARVSEADKEAFTASRNRTQEYQNQLQLVQEQIAAKKKEGAGTEAEQVTLQTLREQYKLQSELDSTNQRSAQANLSVKQQELELLKQQMTLESDIATQAAAAAQAQAQAQAAEYKTVQQKVAAEVAAATKEDQIQQTKIQTKLQEVRLEEEIRKNIIARNNLYQTGIQKNQELLQLLQRQAEIPALFRALSNRPVEENGFSYTGAFQRAGTGFNAANAKYQAKNLTWGIVGGLTGIASATQMLRQAVSNMKDYETAVVNLKRVWQDVPEAQVTKALKDLNEMTIQYGQTVQNVADIQEAWAKVGVRTAEDLEELSKVSILALNTADLGSSDDAVTYLNSARVQMGLTVGDVNALLDSWNKLADVTTGDTADFAEAYQKSAGYAHQVGLAYQELDAIIATMIENTGRSGQEIGTALRQIFANTFTTTNLNKLKSLGIEVYLDEATGQLKDFDVLLAEIAKRYQELKAEAGGGMSEDVIKILSVLGQTRQRNYAIALLENFDKIGLNGNTGEGTYTNISGQSSGYSEKKFEMTMDTLSYKATQLQAAFTQAANSFGQAGILDIMKGLLGLLTNVLTGFSNLDPRVRNFVAQFLTWEVVLGVINKTAKSVFGVTLSQGLVNSLKNVKLVRKEMAGLAAQASAAGNSISKSTLKSTAKGNVANDTIFFNNQAISASAMEKSLKSNKAYMDTLAKQAQKLGKNVEEYQKQTINSVLAQMGSMKHAGELIDAQNAEVQASVDRVRASTEAAAAADREEAAASEQSAQANRDQAAAQRESAGVAGSEQSAQGADASAEHAEAAASAAAAAANAAQAGTQEASAGAAQQEAAAQAGAVNADNAEAAASAAAATANITQAAAAQAAGKAAAIASIKMAAATMGISLVIGAITAGITSMLTAERSMTEVTDTLIARNNELKSEVSQMRSVAEQYDLVQEGLAKATQGTTEYNNLKSQELDLLSKMGELAPSMSFYYDEEHEAVVRNIEDFKDYLAYKEQVLGESNKDTRETIQTDIDATRKKLSSVNEEIAMASVIADLASYMRANDLGKGGISIGSDFAMDGVVHGRLQNFQDVRDVPALSAYWEFFDNMRDKYDLTDLEVYEAITDAFSISEQMSGLALSEVEAKLTEGGYNIAELIDKKSELQQQLGALSGQLGENLLEDLDLDIKKFDTDKLLSRMDAQGTNTETALAEVSDGLDERITSAQSALEDLLSNKTTTNKYKAAQKTLRALLGDYLDTALVGDVTVSEALTGDNSKQYLDELAAFASDKLKDEGTSATATLESLLSTSETLRSDLLNTASGLETEAQRLSDNRRTLYEEIIDYEDLDLDTDGLSDAELARKLEEALGSDLYNSYISAYEYLIQDYKTRASQLRSKAAELTSSDLDLTSALSELNLDNLGIDTPDMASIAQDLLDKLAKADSRAELREVLDQIAAYYGNEDLGLGEGITLENVDLNTPGLIRAVRNMIQRQVTGPLDESENQLHELGVDIDGVHSRYLDLIVYAKTSAEKAGEITGAGGEMEQTFNDLIEALSYNFDLTSGQAPREEDSALQEAIDAFAEKYGKLDVEAALLAFEDGALNMEALSKEVANYIDALDSAYDGYADALDAEVVEAADALRGAFGDLMIGDQLLADMSNQAMIDNADNIALALDQYIQERSGLAYEYALNQVEVAKSALTSLDTLMTEAQDLLQTIYDSLPDAAKAAVGGSMENWLNSMRNQLLEAQTYWQNVADNLEKPKTGSSGLPRHYRKNTSKSRSGGSSSKSEKDQWEWLDKKLEAVEKRYDDLNNQLERLDLIWKNDTDNAKYVAQAYEQQEKIIQNLIASIEELSALRDKVTDADKLDELNEAIRGYENNLIEAYQTLNDLSRVNFEASLASLESGLDRINKKIDLIQASTLSYGSVTASLNQVFYATSQQQKNLGDQYQLVSYQIQQQEALIAKMKADVNNTSMKGLFSTGQLDAEIERLQELKDKLQDIRLSEESIRQTWVSTVSNYMQKMWKAQYDERIERVNKLRKEQEKAHNERINQLEKELETMRKEWQKEDDERELLDLEAKINIVKTRIRRLSADTSQYGQKLLKDAYKELGELESQYNDKKQQLTQSAYEDEIQDQIDKENEAWDNMQDAFDKEQQAYQDQYDTLLENADAFCEGLYNRYLTNQEEVIAYLKSEGLISSYAEAAKMAAAAYNAGLLGTLAENPFLNIGDHIGDEGYNPTPGTTWGNPGDPAPGTNGAGTLYQGNQDYMAMMNQLAPQLKAAAQKGDSATFNNLWNQLKQLEILRNQKVADQHTQGNYNWSQTYDYQGSSQDYWNRYYKTPAASTPQTPATTTPTQPAQTAPSYREYTVKSGDNLSLIAKRMLGNMNRWREIYDLNKSVIGSNPNYLRIGTKLKIPTAHTGGVIGVDELPDEIRALFGLNPRETLVKALQGEYMIPAEMMARALPNIQTALSSILAEAAPQYDLDDFIKVQLPELNIPEGKSSVDQSTTIDKVMNIEHAEFKDPLDVETLEEVAGSYLRNTLARKGVVGPSRQNIKL